MKTTAFLSPMAARFVAAVVLLQVGMSENARAQGGTEGGGLVTERLRGIWTGQGIQFPSRPWYNTIALVGGTPGETVGTMTYVPPNSFLCGGVLKLLSATPESGLLLEDITFGPCIDGGRWLITPVSDSMLRAEWYYPSGGLGATGTWSRISAPTPQAVHDFSGLWQGQGTTVGTGLTWPVVLALPGGDVGNITAVISYPAQQSAGALRLLAAMPDAVEFQETLFFGSRESGGRVRLSMQASDCVLYRWIRADGSLGATGTLCRVGNSALPEPPVLQTPNAVPMASGAEFSFGLHTEMWRTYVFESANSLALPQWFWWRTLTGDGRVTVVHDSTLSSFSRFYRVGLLETRLRLKLPLPGGKHWLLTTEVGDGGCTASQPEPAPSHTGINYFSVDFSPRSQENGGNPEIVVPVYAAGDGRVAVRGTDPTHPNGYYIVLDHDGDGNVQTGYSTRYLHLRDVPEVSMGQMLKQGDRLGIMGGTGGYPVHLHFGLRFADDGGSSEAAKMELRKVLIEGFTLEEYKAECQVGTQIPIKYYYSSNTITP